MESVLNAYLRDLAEAHIQYLANRHDVRVRRTKEWQTSEAEPLMRQVFIPRTFRTGLDYMVALHEFGHILARGADASNNLYEPTTGSGLRLEAVAWGWAVDHANEEIRAALTKTDWRQIGMCWVSHAGLPW